MATWTREGQIAYWGSLSHSLSLTMQVQLGSVIAEPGDALERAHGSLSLSLPLYLSMGKGRIAYPERPALTTRWSTTLPSQANLPHVINFRELCGAILVA